MSPFVRTLLLAAAGVLLHAMPARAAPLLHYGWENVDGVRIFYREGGAPDAPTLVFLHGNPASSLMYEKTMERLVATTDLHVIAMDYPAFGYSDAPPPASYRYTFDHLAATVDGFLRARHIARFGLYMQDYGVPVGFRLISQAPDRVGFIVVQNGVIHLDGFPAAQDPDGELRRHWRERNLELDRRRSAYRKSMTYVDAKLYAEETDGANPELLMLGIASAQRPGVSEGRDDLWFDYGSNVARYGEWQQALEKLHVPVIVLWGSKDTFFTVPGAFAYLKQAPQAEVHILDSVHFATVDRPLEVADLLAASLERQGIARRARHDE